MAIVRKTGIRLTQTEFVALDFFLSIAQSDYEEDPDGKNTVKEIQRLREKLTQMRYRQKK